MLPYGVDSFMIWSCMKNYLPKIQILYRNNFSFRHMSGGFQHVHRFLYL